MPPPQPTDFELQILSLLWMRGSLTARQVLESLPDQKPRAYTSVLSVMQVMEKKGLITHTSQGKTHLYSAAVARKQILGSHLTRLVDLVFGGKPSAVIQTLLADQSLSKEELAEIKSLINGHSKSK